MDRFRPRLRHEVARFMVRAWQRTIDADAPPNGTYGTNVTYVLEGQPLTANRERRPANSPTV
jgi:hypothetical protein